MTLDDARHRLRDRYTVIRSDPFIVDAGLWLAISDLAHSISDAYETRLAWENATDSKVSTEAQRFHRLVHRGMVEKLIAAAALAGLDVARPGAPQSASEAMGGVGSLVEPNRRSDVRPLSDGDDRRPEPTHYSTEDGRLH